VNSSESTLQSMLRERAQRGGDNPLYRFLVQGDIDGPEEILSASALESDARRVAGALRACSPVSTEERPRALVACWSPIEFARAFFGCLKAGIVPVPVNPPFRSSNEGLSGIRAILEDARADLILADASVAPVLSRGALDCGRNFLQLTLTELMTTSVSADFQENHASPDDIAFLQYTSGSTSSPKGVMISHANVLSNLTSWAAFARMPPGAIGVSWLPLAHDLGLIGNLLFILYARSELVLMTPHAFAARPVRWLQAVSKFRAWGTSAPCFALALCERAIRKSELNEVNLSSLEALFCGAEPINSAVLDRFSHRFAPQGFRRSTIRPSYGLAEATLFVSSTEAESLRVRRYETAALSSGRLKEQAEAKGGRTIVSCGRVQTDLSVAIVDLRTSERLEDGHVGEVWLSGNPVARGYFGRSEEENEKTFRSVLTGSAEKFLRTGDLGAIYQGELYITGRIKELIIVRGRNYDAHDLESIAAAAHPELNPGRVVVFADFEHGEQVIVLAELSTRAGEGEYRTIVRRIRKELGRIAGLRPDVVIIAPPRSIPLTTSGKLRRVEVHRLYKSGLIVPLFVGQPDAEQNLDENIPRNLIGKVLAREIKVAARLGRRERINSQVRLSELGVDSLGLVQIAAAMRDFLDRDVPLSVLNDDPPLPLLVERLQNLDHWHEPDSRATFIKENMPDSAISTEVSSKTLPELGILFFASEDQADIRERYKFVHDAARFADRKGFSAVWVPERHFHPFGGLFPSPAVLSASIAVQTNRIRLRAGSVVLPLNDPLRVAEEWGMVDNLSGGRVDLALATGWDADSFALAPGNYASRQEVLFDYAVQLRDLWSGDGILRRNGAGVDRSLRTYPRPLQPKLRLWITATHRSELFERAGAQGFHVLTALLMQDLDELAANVRRYRASRQAAGLDPTGGCVSVMLHTYVGASDDEARNTARGPLTTYLKSSIDLWSKEAEELKRLPEDQVAEVAVNRYMDRSSLIGDSTAALAMLAKLRGMGIDEVACLVDFGIAPNLALQSIERLSNAINNVRQPHRGSEPELRTAGGANERHALKNVAFEDVFEPARRFQEIIRKSDPLPFYHPFSDWEGTHARVAGKRVLILSAFDYLGLGRNDRVREAAARAALQSGASRSSSRVHSGTTPETLALEKKLAGFLHREDAFICTTGYQAMAAVVTAFMNSRTTLVVDEAIHASILDGAATAHCRVKRFRHNDCRDLVSILDEANAAMLMVEGLYSNHGDLAPLRAIHEICRRQGVRLALDDAHGLGVLGSAGRGAEEHHDLIGACDIIAGTFSKSLASIGGWIAGDREVLDYVRYHGRSALFTAAIAPPMVAAAAAALDVLLEQPELVNQLARNAAAIRGHLRACGVPFAGDHGPIVRVPVYDEAKCIRICNSLLRRGIYVNSVLYPSVPRNEAMIRICVSASHDSGELCMAAQEFGDAYRSVTGSDVLARNQTA
jgi:natural product biosynthesis luciferase-like monooxygenase protein